MVSSTGPFQVSRPGGEAGWGMSKMDAWLAEFGSRMTESQLYGSTILTGPVFSPTMTPWQFNPGEEEPAERVMV